MRIIKLKVSNEDYHALQLMLKYNPETRWGHKVTEEFIESPDGIMDALEIYMDEIDTVKAIISMDKDKWTEHFGAQERRVSEIMGMLQDDFTKECIELHNKYNRKDKIKL